MEIPINQLPPGDPRLVDAIVSQLKSKGIFDKFRKECLADVDTKPAFLNLRTRLDGQVKKFLGNKTWKNDLNKNQLRESVRKNIQDSKILDSGVDAIVNQVVHPKVKPLILPLVEETVYNFLQIEVPKRELEENEYSHPPMYGQQPFYGGNYSAPQPYPPHPMYQETPPLSHPPPFQHVQEEERLLKMEGIKSEWGLTTTDASSSWEPISQENTDTKEFKVEQTHSTFDSVPMQTDVISSGDDEILACVSPRNMQSSDIKKSTIDPVKVEGDNAVDSFDSARKEADNMTSAVEKLTIEDNKSQSKMECDSEKDSISNTGLVFDSRSLDNISSNSSGLSLTAHQNIEDQSSSVNIQEDTEKDLHTTPLSAESTPLRDERLSHAESISSIDSGDWNNSVLNKDLSSVKKEEPSSAKSLISSADTNSPKFIEGASPISSVSRESNTVSPPFKQSSLKESSDKLRRDDKSEGEITTTTPSSNASSPSDHFSSEKTSASAPKKLHYKETDAFQCQKESLSKKTDHKSFEKAKYSSQSSSGEHSKEKRDDVHSKSKKDNEKRDSGRDKYKVESKRHSSEHDRRKHSSKSSKSDDHSSHRDNKHKHHRKDHDDDDFKDRRSGRDSHSSAHRTSGSSSSKYDDKDKRDKNNEKSYRHSKSHSYKSHSNSKSHSSSSSSDGKRDIRQIEESVGIKELSSDRSKEQKLNKNIDDRIKSKKEAPISTDKFKDKSKPQNVAKPLKEDDTFLLHLTNNRKNIILPKPNEKKTSPVSLMNGNNKDSLVESKIKINDNKNVPSELKSTLPTSKTLNSLSEAKPSIKIQQGNLHNVDSSKFKFIKSKKSSGDAKKEFNEEVCNRKKKDNISVNLSGLEKDKSVQKTEECPNRLNQDQSRFLNKNSDSNDSSIDRQNYSSPVLKKVTIPILSLTGTDLEEYSLNSQKHKTKAKKNTTNKDAHSSPSDFSFPLSVKHFFNSSDDDSEFEGFDSFSDHSPVKGMKKTLPKKKKNDVTNSNKSRRLVPMIQSLSQRKNMHNAGYSSDEMELPSKLKPLTEKINSPLSSPKKSNASLLPSSQLVVVCDSSDSSDMELSLVQYCRKSPQKGDSKSPLSPTVDCCNDFEGFSEHDEFDGFPSMIGIELKNSLTNKRKKLSFSSDEYSIFSSEDEGKIDDYSRKSSCITLFSSDSEAEMGYRNTSSLDKAPSTISISRNLQSSPVKQRIHLRTSDSDSKKPLKKRKISTSFSTDIDPMVKKSKSNVIPERIPVVEFIAKDISMGSYSLLTPEDDRTSGKEYIVDLTERDTSYSPLSPSSDTSTDELKAKNRLNNDRDVAKGTIDS